LWLHLAWMYEDCGDEEMFMIAYGKAREHYAKGWFTERVQLTPENEQRLAILLSEMHYVAEMYEDARKFIFEAVNMKDGNKSLTEISRDRLMEIKEKIHEEHMKEKENGEAGEDEGGE